MQGKRIRSSGEEEMELQASNLIRFASLPIEPQIFGLVEEKARERMASIYELLERGYMEYPDLGSPEEISDRFHGINEAQYWGPRKMHSLLHW